MNKKKRTTNSGGEESGFSLLELMFAAGIMAMTLSLLFGSVITITLSGKVSENRAVAATHLSSVMEELRGASYNALLSYIPPDHEGAGVGEAIEVRCFDAAGVAVPLPVDPESLDGPLPNPLRVECTVEWEGEQGHGFSTTASQLLYR